jgi:apolipoprotein N-acyltransferase
MADKRTRPPSPVPAFALAALSGALLAFSFPKFGHPAFAWIALAPLLVAVSNRRVTGIRAFTLGWVTGAVYFWGTLYWLVQTMTTYGGLSTPVAALCALLLVAYLSLFPALFGWTHARLARTFGAGAVLFAPAVWVASEMGRTYLLDGFPWELLGYSQSTVLPIVQTASLVGVYGLSAVIALVSASAAYAALTPDGRRWRPLAIAGALVLACGLWGAARIRAQTIVKGGTPIKVAVLQGNIAQDEKWQDNPATRDAIVNRYLEMTREAIGRGAKFVLWPESATPLPYEQDPTHGEAIRRLAREGKITLLIGSDQVEPVSPPTPGKPTQLRYYNAAYLIQPSGATAAVYRKIHLVPFGEFVPFKRILFFVGPLVDAVSDFTPGTEPLTLPVEGHRVSTAICYEVIYGSLIRTFVQRGSELLTTITNDAWYGRSSAAYQHWQQASLRAVEEGRYLARAANTGISGFVDPYGRILEQSNMFESAVLADDIRFLTDRTVYNRIGDLVGWLSIALTFAALLATVRKVG